MNRCEVANFLFRIESKQNKKLKQKRTLILVRFFSTSSLITKIPLWDQFMKSLSGLGRGFESRCRQGFFPQNLRCTLILLCKSLHCNVRGHNVLNYLVCNTWQMYSDSNRYFKKLVAYLHPMVQMCAGFATPTSRGRSFFSEQGSPAIFPVSQSRGQISARTNV